jgi:hypothetical protein
MLTTDQISLMAHNEDCGDWNDLAYRDIWHKGYMAGALAAESEYINKLEALQAKLDRLMFEYCPEDMTKEQVNKWGKHQVVFKG